MAKRIRVAIADDHTLVCQSLAKAVESDKQFIVVGTARNGRELIDVVERNHPEVVILDLEMPVMSGWETLDYLKIHHPSCRVIVITMYLENLNIESLAAKGARGFLPKSADFVTLVNALYEVNNLGYFFSHKIHTKVVEHLMNTEVIKPPPNEVKLNDREIAVLLLICKDLPTSEIAKAMFVTERTVERSKRSLVEKTKARTTAGLVLFALRNNYLLAAK